jgi:hypothetical protein
MKLKWIKLKNGKEKLVPADFKEEKKVRVFGAIEVMQDGKRIIR